MKCTRCAAEVPGQAQFCMKCGTPVSAGRPGGAVTMARPVGASPQRSNKTALIAGILAGVVVLAVASFFTYKNLTASNAKVAQSGRLTDVNARALDGAGLVDKNARITSAGPLTDNPGTAQPGPADPVEIIDYIKHVREIERQRLALKSKQLSTILNGSAKIQASNIGSEMTDHPEEGHKQAYNELQEDIAKLSSEFEDLSRKFNAYPKAVPQSCTGLRDRYLDFLGKMSAQTAAVGGAFASALSGNSGNALEQLTAMQGKASQEVDGAADAADKELGNVCDKYHLHKEFDIRADGGASNPFGVGR